MKLRSHYTCITPNTEIALRPHIEMDRLSSETKSRIAGMAKGNPSTRVHLNNLWREWTAKAMYVPEALARRDPEGFGKLFSVVTTAMASYKRQQQRFNHQFVEDLALLGMRRGTLQNSYGHMFKHNVLKSHLIGPDALTNAQLRRLVSDFADNRIDYDRVLMANRIEWASPDDVAGMRQQMAKAISVLNDRDLDMIRRSAVLQDEIRTHHMKVKRAAWVAQGISGEELEDRMLRYFGPDLDAYAARLPYHMRMSYLDLKAGSTVPELEGFYTNELEHMESLWGGQLKDERFASEVADLANWIHRGGRDPNTKQVVPFRFSDPQSLGLSEPRDYTDAREALGDLFDLDPEWYFNDPNAEKEMSTLLSAMRRLGRDPHRGGVVGTIKAIPEQVMVRFYKRRTLNSDPSYWSLVDEHSAYMNSVIKAINFDPALEQIVPVIKAIQRADPARASMMINYFDDTIGNPRRASMTTLQEAGRLTSFFYKGTLVGNFSATLSNYLGQTGFIMADMGVRPTTTAILALAQSRNGPKGKYAQLVELMTAEGIGREAIPSGHFASDDPYKKFGALAKMHVISMSDSVGEAWRRTKRYGIDSADIFATSEMRLHKIAYLTGMIRHLEKEGIWNQTMPVDALQSRLATYLASPGTRHRIAEAGERGIARGAFLFGNINRPGVIRWMYQDPSGVGTLAGMFTNYNIQAFYRLASWTHDASRLARNLRDPVGREGFAKLTRFFAIGTLVAGPFFMVPILRSAASEGDMDDPGWRGFLSRLKNMFVAWEKRFSFAGLIGHGIKATTGEYETIELAEKLSPINSFAEAFGPTGGLFHGPAIQFGTNLYQSVFGSADSPGPGGATAARARESLIGGALEHAISGEGNLSKPLPASGIMTMLPGGVAFARLINSFTASGVFTDAPDLQLDRYGRVVNPTSISTEIIRQFGRPLGEVLQGAEGRYADREAETRTRNAEKIKRAALDGNMAMVGDLLANDPSLIESMDSGDLMRASMSRTLTPQARAMMTSARPLMLKALSRAAARLQSGNLTPAEEFTIKQQIAIGMMRLRKMQNG